MDGSLSAVPEGPVAVAPGPSPQASRDLRPLVAQLTGIVGAKWVYTDEHELRTYESDGLLQYSAIPAAAILPGSAEEVAAVVGACARANVPWVARGAGSGLSGGALPIADGVLIVLSRMKRILEIDLENQRVCVEPGRDQRVGRPPPSRRRSSIHPIPPARSSARSAATWPRTPAARTASSTASPPTT